MAWKILCGCARSSVSHLLLEKNRSRNLLVVLDPSELLPAIDDVRDGRVIEFLDHIGIDSMLVLGSERDGARSFLRSCRGQNCAMETNKREVRSH